MTHAIRVHAVGGPEVMRWEDVSVGAPGAGEVRLRQVAVGLNYIDVYHRTGLYPLPLPFTPGLEGAGVVEAVGDGVADFKPGDRVAYASAIGGYAEVRTIAASGLVHLPDAIGFDTAAAMMLQGMTVDMLINRVRPLQAGETILVHAAAGGVGLILVQWLKHIGATVIGTASTEAKAERARAAGADHMILSGSTDIAAQVRDLTDGRGVRVTFDGVGQDTWDASLNATGPRGMIVSFGNASGAVSGINLATISAKGSLFVTRPGLFHYYSDPLEREAGSDYVFDMIQQGIISVSIDQRYALEDAAQAHRDLEARLTTGSTILVP